MAWILHCESGTAWFAACLKWNYAQMKTWRVVIAVIWKKFALWKQHQRLSNPSTRPFRTRISQRCNSSTLTVPAFRMKCSLVWTQQRCVLCGKCLSGEERTWNWPSKSSLQTRKPAMRGGLRIIPFRNPAIGLSIKSTPASTWKMDLSQIIAIHLIFTIGRHRRSACPVSCWAGRPGWDARCNARPAKAFGHLWLSKKIEFRSRIGLAGSLREWCRFEWFESPSGAFWGLNLLQKRWRQQLYALVLSSRLFLSVRLVFPFQTVSQCFRIFFSGVWAPFWPNRRATALDFSIFRLFTAVFIQIHHRIPPRPCSFKDEAFLCPLLLPYSHGCYTNSLCSHRQSRQAWMSPKHLKIKRIRYERPQKVISDGLDRHRWRIRSRFCCRKERKIGVREISEVTFGCQFVVFDSQRIFGII